MVTVQLYCGDALEVLPTLEAGSVASVITDPPYGVGSEHLTSMTIYAIIAVMMRDERRLNDE